MTRIIDRWTGVAVLVSAVALGACSGTSEISAADGSSTGGAGGGGGQGSGGTGGATCSEKPLVPAECLAFICDAGLCGTSDSYLDASGCYRERCENSDQCGQAQECRPLTYAPYSCGITNGKCECGKLLVTKTERFCLPK